MRFGTVWAGSDCVVLMTLKKASLNFLNRNPTTCFVAVEDDKIIGTILCGHDGRRGYIYHLAVAEEYRRKGIASQLLLNACEALKKKAYRKRACWCLNRMKPAMLFGTDTDGISARMFITEICL